MKYRDHINLSFLIFNVIVYVSILTTSFSHYLSSSMMFIGFLFGTALPDFDIKFYEYGHRQRSPFHNIVNAVSFSAAAYFISKLVLAFEKLDTLPQLQNFVFSMRLYDIFMFMTCLGLGWVCHLVGDIIQGGVKCGKLKSQLGITKWNWDKYYGEGSPFDISYIGNLFSLLMFVFSVISIMSLNSPFFSKNYSFILVWILFLSCKSLAGLTSKFYGIVIVFGLLYLVSRSFI